MNEKEADKVKVQCRTCEASWEVRRGCTYWPFCQACIDAGRSYEYLQNCKVNKKPIAS